MTLLQKAKPEMAYLKAGLYGEAGSGKTFTASQFAIGLHKYIKSKKAIGFLDTETGSDFVRPIFKNEKIEFITAKTRAFKDVLTVVDEAEKNCSILIIDSITHIWNEMTDSYCKMHKIARITLNHWQPIKRVWKDYTDRFINSALHIIMAGRSADKWDYVEDDEGVKELQKVGTKMRGETQIGYEPSLLIEMEQFRKSAKVGGGWINRAWVVKDRWNLLNHKSFDFKHFDGLKYKEDSFKAFLPHIEMLNLGGKHRAIDMDRTSEEMFEKNKDGAAVFKKIKILTEKVQNALYRAFPSPNKKEDKIGRLDLLKKAFDTDSWTDVCSLRHEDLEVGLAIIESEIKKEAK